MLNNLIYNKNYGFSKKDFSFNDIIVKLFAIPYIAIDSPLEDSEFTDFELIIVLTILSYYYNNDINVNIIYNIFLYLKHFIFHNDHSIAQYNYPLIYKYLDMPDITPFSLNIGTLLFNEKSIIALITSMVDT
jgi:hypothetical protein